MTDAKFDLNTAHKGQLMDTLGIDEALATKIIALQPTPRKDAKFDLNTADKGQLVDTLGINEADATKIIALQRDRNRDYWDMLDKQFKDIMTAGKSAFVINKAINVIIVSIGVALILSSILQTWIPGKNADPWSTLMSGIGVGSFVIVFFNKPQSNINKAVASLASLSMIYKGHKLEYEKINDAMEGLYNPNGNGSISHIKTMTHLNKVLEDSTKHYVTLLNTHLEVFSDDTSKSKDKSVGGKDTSKSKDKSVGGKDMNTKTDSKNS